MSTNGRPELIQLCLAVLTRLDTEKYVAVAALVASALTGSSNLHDPEHLQRGIELNTKAGGFSAVSDFYWRLAILQMYRGDLQTALQAANRAEETLQLVPPSKTHANDYVRSE